LSTRRQLANFSFTASVAPAVVSLLVNPYRQPLYNLVPHLIRDFSSALLIHPPYSGA